jgi:hypothetical protein
MFVGADAYRVNLKLRRRPSSPPPVVAPGVNSRVSIVVEGVRYGGRVDDVETGALVIAAPDVQLAAERPVMLEWRDSAGVWMMPAEVVSSRLHPFPTTSLRPTGASECVRADAHADSPVRLSGRIVASPRLPRGTRVPVTTANVDGGELVLWTILPLERGDLLDIVASTGGSSLQQARLRVTNAAPQSGSWLARITCRPAEDHDPSALALVGAVRARVGRAALASV